MPHDVIIISDSEENSADKKLVSDSEEKFKTLTHYAKRFGSGHPLKIATSQLVEFRARLARTEKRRRHVKELNASLMWDLKSQSALRELILCDICRERFRAPYTLPNCGHVFCGSCLVNWFRSCRVLGVGVYTCPMCCKMVQSSPVEAFTLKKIVAAIADSDATSMDEDDSTHGLELFAEFFAD